MSGVASTLLYGAVAVLAEIIVLVLIAVRGRGRARRIGVAGAVILLIGAVLNAGLSIAAPIMFTQLDLPLSVYPLLNLPITVLHGVAVIVIAVAVGTHAREERAFPQQQQRQPDGWSPPLYPR